MRRVKIGDMQIWAWRRREKLLYPCPTGRSGNDEYVVAEFRKFVGPVPAITEFGSAKGLASVGRQQDVELARRHRRRVR